MLQSGHLSEELQTLKNDVSRLLNTSGDRLRDATMSHADALADQIKAALGDLGETIGDEGDRINDIISERPVATLASAFALGVVVGFMLRRR